MIDITLNGQPHQVPDGATVWRLLEQLDLTEKRIAVERNGEIVPRSLHSSESLGVGDRIEIVHAIGGG